MLYHPQTNSYFDDIQNYNEWVFSASQYCKNHSLQYSRSRLTYFFEFIGHKNVLILNEVTD